MEDGNYILRLIAIIPTFGYGFRGAARVLSYIGCGAPTHRRGSCERIVMVLNRMVRRKPSCAVDRHDTESGRAQSKGLVAAVHHRPPAGAEAVTFTAEDKMNCALRELRMRERVYPGWVEKGRITAEKSERELALMAAIVEDYRALVAKERLL